jgi:ATP-binding cassette subfamily B protein
MTLFKNYIVKQWKLFIIPFFAMIICICADSSYPYFQKIFIDNIILENNHDYLTIFLGIISMIALLHGLFAYINEFLLINLH